MKRFILSLLLAAALLLGACSGQETPTEPSGRTASTEDHAVQTAELTAIDHCVVEPDERAAMSEGDREQYRRLMDAMLARADSVTLDIKAQRMDFLQELLRESPYYFFTDGVEVSGTTVSFRYAYTEREQSRILALIDRELLKIVNHQIAPDDNELDMILKIYAAVGSRISYDQEREDNKQLGSPLFDYPADEVYKALHENKSLCFGFAHVLRYALLQRGIDAFCVYGQCTSRDMGHEWVIIRYDGAYFHCDPAWDRGSGGTAKLMHFGTTDLEREQDTLAMRPFEEYHLPVYGAVACTDKRFSIFRGAVGYTCADGHRYVLEDKKGNRTVFNSEDFSLSRE